MHGKARARAFAAACTIACGLLLAGLAPPEARAQPAPTPCPNTANQTELTLCAQRDQVAAEAALNAAYRERWRGSPRPTASGSSTRNCCGPRCASAPVVRRGTVRRRLDRADGARRLHGADRAAPDAPTADPAARARRLGARRSGRRCRTQSRLQGLHGAPRRPGPQVGADRLPSWRGSRTATRSARSPATAASRGCPSSAPKSSSGLVRGAVLDVGREERRHGATLILVSHSPHPERAVATAARNCYSPVFRAGALRHGTPDECSA